jgi:hypothetical protein
MSRRRAPAGVVAAGAALAALGGACSDDCCIIDSFPISLTWSPLGAGVAGRPGGLLAQAQSMSINGGAPFALSVDTGSPLTVSDGSADGTAETVSRSFDILGAPPATSVRASFRDINMLSVPLGAVGDAATKPQAVLGGDLLRGFSIELRFGVPSMTFWPNQRADDGFLEDVGYAVIHFTPFGGGELSATGSPDIFGQRGPVSVAPTRVVFRACGAPDAFDPATPTQQTCCQRGDDVADATGAPLSLMLATGVGPLVLSRSAWTRLLPHLQPLPVETPGLLYLAAAPTPLAVSWTILPADAHVALVNQEATAAADPGPCVELARSRRIEWVAYRQALHADEAACVQPCDTDPNDTQKAQNSAAYVEVGGDVGSEIPVAILDDGDLLLQGLRADIRPEGPELDGIIGAGVLARTRVELDYKSSGPRAIFSCDGMSTRNQCWTAARCPRLPDQTQLHACFNLPLAGLPATCADNLCGS